jgi:hypothetical protein
MACFSLCRFVVRCPFPVGPISTQVNFQANALVFAGKVTQSFLVIFLNRISQAIDCMDIFILFSGEGSC